MCVIPISIEICQKVEILKNAGYDVFGKTPDDT